MIRETKINFLINCLFYSLIAVILFFSIKFLFVYLFPLIIGTIVTVLMQHPALFISQRTGIRKGVCALILVIIIYLFLLTMVFFIAFKLGVYVSNIATNYSGIVGELTELLDSFIVKINELAKNIPSVITGQLTSVFESFAKSISSYISDFAKNTAKAMPMFITSSVVTVIASCYIAKDYDRFKASVCSIISRKYKRALVETKSLLKDNILKLVVGYLKLMTITFFELTLGFVLLRVDNAVLLAVVVALLDLLPIIGTGTVLIPWGIYKLITAEYFLGAGLIIVYVIIMLVRNIVEPKIIGKQIGLHPLIALIAVFIGIKLFGFVGIFAIPLAIMILYKMFDKGIFDILLEKQ